MGCPMSLALLCLLAIPGQDAPPAVSIHERINAAIEAGVGYLERRELSGESGTPGLDGRVGARALAVYALLKSGVPERHPAVSRELEALATATPTGTYDSACLLLAWAALEAGRDEEAMQRHADWLVRNQQGGIWGYPGGGDLSNTQYAALGLWAADRAGIEVPIEVWERLGDGVLKHQDGDGGFSYSGRGHSTGSMTAAGVGCLAIALERLSAHGRLERGVHEHYKAAMEEGLNWLGREFDVSQNPRAGRSWHLYWLYGLERVGALAGVAQIGGHDWYLEGARELVGAQSADGAWRGASGGELVSTCFALLFLRRATLPKSGRGWARSRAVYGRDDPGLDVSLRAAGDTPLDVWISRFGKDVLEELSWPGEQGLRIAKVEYLVDYAPVWSEEPDPGRPAESHFPAELELPERGDYSLRARVTVRVPPTAAAPSGVRVLTSEELLVRIRRVDPTWMQALAAERGRQLLRPEGTRLNASSTFRGLDPESYGAWIEADPERAIDGDPRTYWLAAPDDREPSFRIVLREPLEADAVLLNHARLAGEEAGFFARALEVELVLNRREKHRVRLGPGQRAPTVFELPGPVRVRSLEVRVLARAPGAGVDAVGFAEIALQRRGHAPLSRHGQR